MYYKWRLVYGSCTSPGGHHNNDFAVIINQPREGYLCCYEQKYILPTTYPKIMR